MKLRNETPELEPAGADVIPWVEREATIEASPDQVWEALTEVELLEEWLAPEVELEPVEGGRIAVGDGEGRRAGTVETVEEGERLAFTWERPGEGRSFVEFTIEAVPAGTRVLVVETPIEQAGPRASALAWATRLAALGRACSRNGMTPLIA